MSAAAERLPPIRRAASAADAAEIVALVAAVHAEHGLAMTPDGPHARELADLERHYWGRGGRFDVLCDGAGRVVGTVGLVPLDARRIELRALHLAPEWRGQGHGRALLEHALAMARTMGFAVVELETAGAFAAAIALYERQGFSPRPARGGGSPCDRAFSLTLGA